MSTSGRPANTNRGRKKLLQRLYRLTEAEDFSRLQRIIKEITQTNPSTRHDILIKAAEIIRQLDTDYRSLLEATSTSTTTSNTGSPMQHHSTTPDHPVSYFLPESGSMNYDHSTYPYPYMSSLSNMTYSATMDAPVSSSNMYSDSNITQNYIYFNSQSG